MATKEQIFTLEMTRGEMERMAGFANLGVQIVTQQMADPNFPEAMVDKQSAHLKANKALLAKITAPLIAADQKKQAGGPLAKPPAKQNRADRRRSRK